MEDWKGREKMTGQQQLTESGKQLTHSGQQLIVFKLVLKMF